MAMVILDRQHIGKPNKPDDLGAYSELSQEYEAHMVGRYLLETEWTLRKLGHRVVVLSDGHYNNRHKRANEFFAREAGACIYLAGHLNAGGGNYSAIFHDHRSAMGAAAALYIKDALGKIDGLESSKTLQAQPSDWTSNAFHTIDGIYAGRGCGLCLEPFFIDAKQHSHLMADEGLEQVGNAIAVGVDAWIASLKRG